MGADYSLIQSFRQGNASSFDMLINIYKKFLYSLCYRLTLNRNDADDLFQETWLRVAKNCSKYRGNSFKGWLYIVCLNAFKDQYRRNHKKAKLINNSFSSIAEKDYAMIVSSASTSAEDEVLDKHIKNQLVIKINALDEKYKVPVILYYYQGLRYIDIAMLLDLPEGTVKSRISTAKAKLKKMMEAEKYV